MADNNIGEEGANALGPHVASLSNLTKLELGGATLLVVDVSQFVV